MSIRITALAGAALLSIVAMGGLAAAFDTSAVSGQPDETAITAPAGEYRIDPVHSALIFRIKHMDVAWFYGRFNEMSGAFTYDPADPTKSSITMTVPAASIDTNNSARDNHVKSADYFDVENHPDITFTSTAIRPAGNNMYKVQGDLTFMGQTRSITADVEMTGAGEGRGGAILGLEAIFTFKRSDFGMKVNPKALSDEVKIMAGLECRQRRQ